MQFMKFKEYAPNKFMSINSPSELDIIVNKNDSMPYVLKNVFDSYCFKTWNEAVRFAEHKFGVIFDLEEKV